jgi:hypothetical protein
VVVTEVVKLLTQVLVEQVALAAVEDTAQEAVVGQSLPQMVEQQLLVKDMREELGVNQTIMVEEEVVVLVRLVQTHQLQQVVMVV